MRSRTTTGATVLLAALAILATAAASASAAVEFAKPYPNRIELKGGGTGTLQTVTGKTALPCTATTATGEITGATSAAMIITFTGCESCASEGAKAGEVKTALLEGTPYYINEGKGIGLLLKRKGTGNFAEFNCGTGESKRTVNVRGAVIGTLSVPNYTTKEFHLTLKDLFGVQEPSEYTGGKEKETLEAEQTGKEAYAFTRAGLATHEVNELLTSEATKINAQFASRGLPEFGPEIPVITHSPFEGKQAEGKSINFESKNGSKWSASKATIKGNIIDPNEVALTITLSEWSSQACAFSTTGTLIGRLGYLNKTTKEVGLLLEPMGSRIAKCFSSLLGAGEYKGSVIGKITPVGTLSSALTLKYKSPSRGVQEFEKFEGESVLHHLEGCNGSCEADALITELELNKFNQQVEIKA